MNWNNSSNINTNALTKVTGSAKAFAHSVEKISSESTGEFTLSLNNVAGNSFRVYLAPFSSAPYTTKFPSSTTQLVILPTTFEIRKGNNRYITDGVLNSSDTLSFGFDGAGKVRVKKNGKVVWTSSETVYTAEDYILFVDLGFGSAAGSGFDIFNLTGAVITNGIVTNRQQVVTAEPFPVTTSNTVFTDLNFGLTTNIVAKPSDFNGVAPYTEYSQQQGFNKDSTYLWISVNAQPYYATWNKVTNTRGTWVALANARPENVWWSGVSANIIYYVSSDQSKFFKKNVSTGAITEIFTFSNLLGTGSCGQTFMSTDTDKYLSGEYRTGGTNAERKWFLIDLQSNLVIKNEFMVNGARNTNGANDVHVNPNGTYIYLCSNYTDDVNLDSEVQQIYHIATDTLYNFGKRFNAGVNDACGFGHMDLGNDYLVGENGNGNGIVSTPLSSLLSGGVAAFRTAGTIVYEAEYITQPSGAVKASGSHTCYKSGQWALISHYDQRSFADRAAATNVDETVDECFLVNVTTSDRQIKRVAKHHVNQGYTNGAYEYNKLPRANISPDGEYILLNTTLDVLNGDTSVVVVKIV